MAVKGNKKVKKVINVFSVGVLLVCTIAIRIAFQLKHLEMKSRSI